MSASRIPSETRTPRMEPLARLPVFLSLEGRRALLAGGTPAAAQLHVCRTVCRRAERRAIAIDEEGTAEVVRYLNRLSDLLFILSRAANTSEPLWAPGAHGASPSPD